MKTITFILYVFLITPTLQAEVLSTCLGVVNCLDPDLNVVHSGSLTGASTEQEQAFQTWEEQNIVTFAENATNNTATQLASVIAAAALGDLVTAQTAATAAMAVANVAAQYAADGVGTVAEPQLLALASQAMINATSAATTVTALGEQLAPCVDNPLSDPLCPGYDIALAACEDELIPQDPLCPAYVEIIELCIDDPIFGGCDTIIEMEVPGDIDSQ